MQWLDQTVKQFKHELLNMQIRTLFYSDLYHESDRVLLHAISLYHVHAMQMK